MTNIPPNTNTDHIKHLYPNADEVKVVHNGPGLVTTFRARIGEKFMVFLWFSRGRSYAYVHYPDEEERDADFNNGPLPIGPGDTIDGTGKGHCSAMMAPSTTIDPYNKICFVAVFQMPSDERRVLQH